MELLLVLIFGLLMLMVGFFFGYWTSKVLQAVHPAPAPAPPAPAEPWVVVPPAPEAVPAVPLPPVAAAVDVDVDARRARMRPMRNTIIHIKGSEVYHRSECFNAPAGLLTCGSPQPLKENVQVFGLCGNCARKR